MTHHGIRVAIADDHRVFTQGLAALVGGEGFEVTFITASRDELAESLLADPADVALVDLAMPGIGILDLLAILRQRHSPTRLLILTAEDDAAVARDLLEAGVAGYLLKEHAFDDIVAGIRAVAAGKSFVSPGIAGQLLQGGSRRTDQRQKATALTTRQLEILRLVAAGDTSKRIARKLGLHVKTVDNHRSQIRQKLGVHSSAEMIRVAGERGLF